MTLRGSSGTALRGPGGRSRARSRASTARTPAAKQPRRSHGPGSTTGSSCSACTQRLPPRQRRQRRQPRACGLCVCRCPRHLEQRQMQVCVTTRRAPASTTRASPPRLRPGCRACLAPSPTMRRLLGSAVPDGPSRRPCRRIRRIPEPPSARTRRQPHMQPRRPRAVRRTTSTRRSAARTARTRGGGCQQPARPRSTTLCSWNPGA
mmetsp:Transcript_9517/g.25840  ORF Transcript_9517/g.25840 Transcript_9517/m.25840 type:complete len:206 (+) Transcript_9517:223-840(+)